MDSIGALPLDFRPRIHSAVEFLDSEIANEDSDGGRILLATFLARMSRFPKAGECTSMCSSLLWTLVNTGSSSTPRVDVSRRYNVSLSDALPVSTPFTPLIIFPPQNGGPTAIIVGYQAFP